MSVWSYPARGARNGQSASGTSSAFVSSASGSGTGDPSTSSFRSSSRGCSSFAMLDLLAPGPHEAVLEVGTGLGYQAAVLAELAARVWSVEVVEELAGAAE